MLDHSKTSLLQKEGEGGEGKQTVCIFLVDFFWEEVNVHVRGFSDFKGSVLPAPSLFPIAHL